MAYRIKLHPSNIEFVAEANESILDAGLRQGVMLPYGCRGGVCGSCAATILTGLVHYPFGKAQGLTAFDETRGKAYLCMAAAASDLELEVANSRRDTEIEVKTLPVRVEKMQKLAPDVMELSLKLPASERLRFLPGQYIDILLKDGTRRSFSLANAPFNDQLLELHVRHVPNGKFTSYVFNEMQAKALLRIEGPLGGFYIHESERPLILMGGGTGFAPLKSMLEQLMEMGLTRPVYLYWGVRAKADLYMNALVQSWVARHPLLSYVPVLSAPNAADQWQGRTGYVHAAVATDFPDLSTYDVYMSGPPPMIEAAKPVFLAQGLPDKQLYADAFEYSPDTLNAIKTGA